MIPTMSMMQRARTGAAAALVSAVAAAAHAGVPSYNTFELQVRSNIVDGYNLPAGSSFNSGTPAINDDATVSIRLLNQGLTGPGGVWVGADGSGSVVYSVPAELSAGDPSINSDGDVAFEVFDIFTEGVWLYDAQSDSTNPAFPLGSFSSFGGVGVNDSGVFGFRGKIGFGAQAWYTHDGTTLTTYVSEGGEIAFLFVPNFNNANQLAGKVRLGGTGNDNPDEIRRYEADGSFTLIAADDDVDPKSPFTGFDNGVSLADDGRVAFIANLVGGGRGVFVGDGESITEVATTTNDAILSDVGFFAPDVNASGLTVFRGEDADGLNAIFVGDGGELIRLIGEEDTITSDLGLAMIDQHDSSIPFGGQPRINNHGDIAFVATLTPAGDNQVEWGSGLYIAYAEATKTECPADLDGDESVGVGDLLQLLSAWGDCAGCAEDLDDDDAVGVGDLLELLGAWGSCE